MPMQIDFQAPARASFNWWAEEFLEILQGPLGGAEGFLEIPEAGDVWCPLLRREDERGTAVGSRWARGYKFCIELNWYQLPLVARFWAHERRPRILAYTGPFFSKQEALRLGSSPQKNRRTRRLAGTRRGPLRWLWALGGWIGTAA